MSAGVVTRRLAAMRRDAFLRGVAVGIAVAVFILAPVFALMAEDVFRQRLPLHCSWSADSVVHLAPR